MRSKRSWILGPSIATLLAVLSLSSRATPVTLNRTYTNIPMSFGKNVGQSRAGVDFIAKGSGYSVFLSPNEAVLGVKKQQPKDRTSEAAKHEPGGATIRMTLAGSGPAQAAGEDQLPGKANYVLGSDSAKWYRDVPMFAKVRYAGVYPGIDVVYYGNQGQLEYDFIVNSGADPQAITLAFAGADTDINKDGDLVLSVAGGSLSMRHPYIYQQTNGVKHEVAGGYVKRNDGRIGFAVGPYDTTLPLVIDPVLLYSTYLGGTGSDDAVTAIAVDQSGNAYITGKTISSDFPTQNPGQPTSGGGFDAFVTKIDPSGSALVYSTYFGGTGDDFGAGIAVDGSGQAYVAGRTYSKNFPTTARAYQTIYGGEGDAFVAKFDASGTTLIYSTYVGGDGYDEGTAIAIDGSGDAYITGTFYISSFPTTAGAFQTVNGGAFDAFVTKLNPAGSALVYSTYLGGITDEGGLAIAVDPQGNAYVTGCTGSSNFPMQSPQQQFGGYYDAFLTKLNPSGAALVYSTFVGGKMFERAWGIAVDAQGNAYITGQTGSDNFPTTAGAYQPIFGNILERPELGDAFVAKYNPSGSVLYSTYLGGPGGENSGAIAIDQAGNAYVTGNNYEGGFPLKDPLQTDGHVGSFEGFVSKLSPDGSSLLYSTYLGGYGNEHGLGIAVDLLGAVYVAGFSGSEDFPTTPGAFQTTNHGNYDGFVVKIATASAGKITGGGSVDVPGGIGTFGFTVQRKTIIAPIQGDLQYINHATGAKVHSVSFNAFTIGASTATFGGTCVNNGVPCTFTVTVTDNGEPGDNDTFIISISGGPAQGGTLRSGNIQLH